MSLSPGDAFGRFRIEGLLGAGGMGEVYRARDETLDRNVAIKVVRAPAGDAEARATFERRLIREARAAAALEHPNAVAIYDVGEADGQAYIAMELVEGRPLKAYVGDAEVPLATRLRWITDVARALAAAHARGLVHRDIKPSNVMVREDGAIKVLDFGIARRVATVAAPDDTTLTGEGGDLAFTRTQPTSSRDGASGASPVATLTAEGRVVGTPLYMAPEQMRGEEVDARADQFSWGVLAYELLAGKKPWGEALSLSTLAEALSKEPPPLRELVPELPRGVEETIARALSKSRAARFRAMDEIVRRLESGERGDAGRRWPLVALAVAAAVGAAWLGIARPWRAKPASPVGSAASTTTAPAPREPFTIASAPEQITSIGECAASPIFADDGTIVFAVHDGEREQIYRLDRRTREATPLVPGADGDITPAPGEPGRVLFLHSRMDGADEIEVRSAPVSGGEARTEVEKGIGGPAWWARGALFMLRADNRAIRKRAAGSTVDVVLYEAPSGNTFFGLSASDDARFVATKLFQLEAQPTAPLCIADADGGRLDCESAGRTTSNRAAFSSGGRGAYYGRRDTLVRLDTATRTTATRPLSPPARSLAIAPDGASLVYSSCRALYEVRRYDDGGKAAPLEVSLPLAGTTSVGPHGALAMNVENGDTSALAVTDDDGTHVRVLTSGAQLVVEPVFSPDGRRLAYHDASANGGIFVIDATGVRGAARLTANPGDNLPNWLDDDHVVFLRPETGNPYGRAYVAAVSGGEPRALPNLAGVPFGAIPERGVMILVILGAKGNRLAECGTDGQVRPIALDGAPKTMQMDGAIVASPSGRYVAWVDGDTAWRADLRTRRAAPLPAGIARPTTWAVLVDDDGRVTVVDRRTTGQLYEVRGRFE